MKPSHDIVVSDLSISSKEQQMKQRFLNNTKPDPAKPPEPIQKDPVFSSFLEDLQHSLKSQKPCVASEDLLKQQAHIMQQQVDLLKQEQKSFQQVIHHISRNTSEEPKRLLAEMLVPLDKQIKEVKSFYEETKTTAKEISLQVTDLKKALDEKRPPGKLHKNVEDGMTKFSQKKQAFDFKVKEAENMVSSLMEDDKLSTCKHGIQYLRDQIEAVHKDAEKIEIDMQARFRRIVEQAQKVKSVPQDLSVVPDFEGAEERLMKILGGRLDYDDILFEINELSVYKTRIIQEYKKMTPVYPKFSKPVQVQIVEKKTVQKKPAQLVPVPVGTGKKTLKTKPSSLNYVTAQTKIITKSSKQASSRSSDKSSIIENPPKSYKKKPDNVVKTPPKVTLNEIEPVRSPPRSPSPVPEDFAPMPKAPSPEPFRTRPGVTKGEQTKQVTFDQIYPSLKNIETQEPPKPNIVEKTVDAVTQHVLNQLLFKQKNPPKPSEPKATKWLGSEEISELTRLGLYFDPLTIEKVGLEVLKQEIQDLKHQTVSLTKESKIEKEDYEDDFEEEKIEEPVFNKISPKTPPAVYEQRFEKEPNLPSEEIPEVQNLFDPKLLGRMSSASIQQYLSALIDSGHIPRAQGTPSFFSRSPTPKTQPMTAPQMKYTADTTVGEKIPEELKESAGEQIFSSVKESPTKKSQILVVESSTRKGFNINYPPLQEFRHSNTEFDVFGRPQSRGTRIFDIDAEEKKIIEESTFVRKTIQVPVLEIQRKSQSSHGEYLVTDSEVSGLSHTGSVGSEVFNIENTEIFGGFMEFVRKARELEIGQVPANEDLSEGEVRMSGSLSSGEVTTTNLKVEVVRMSGSGVLSEDDFEVSEEESDPQDIFKVE